MTRPERVQAAFDIVAKGSDPGKTGKQMMDYILALEAKVERMDAALKRISCLSQTENLLWWQQDARAARKEPT
jgi:hypothetical protein